MPSARATGVIAWVGLAAADAPAAVEFYTGAFGWEAAREPDHTKLRKGGRDVALVYPQTPQARAANVTSHWSPFFLVADADLAMERAVQLDGMALRDSFDRRLRAIVQRFADAFERGEVGAIRAMLAEEATFANGRISA